MGKKKKDHKTFGASDESTKSKAIGKLDTQTVGYYRRVSDALKEGFEDEEEKALLLKNVFTQLNEEALKVSRNQTVSTIVELLLREGSEEQLTAFMVAFSADWETACTDRFAGYVTQTLLQEIQPFITPEEEPQSPKTLFLSLYNFLLGNVAVYMQDTYASHVLRVVIEILGGCEVSEKVIRSKAARSRQQEVKENVSNKTCTPPDDFKEYLEKLSRKIFTMKRLKGVYQRYRWRHCRKPIQLSALAPHVDVSQLDTRVQQYHKVKISFHWQVDATILFHYFVPDHAENFLSNPVLQTLLLVLSRVLPDFCEEMCDLLINNTGMFDQGKNNSLPSLLTHPVGSHLVEQLVFVASESRFTALVDHHFTEHHLEMALHPVANYIIQRVISRAHDKEQFQAIFSLLAPHMEDILAHNRMGIITGLAEGCLKHSAKQKKLIKNLMKAFHCYEPIERQMKIVPLLSSLKTYEVFYEVKDDSSTSSDDEVESDEEEDTHLKKLPQLTTVVLHGSLLLQKLLLFANPRPLVNSLMDLSTSELFTLACDKSGSHILDAFLRSPTVGQKSHDRLYNKLKDLYVKLACDKSGSRVMDSLLAQASMKQKEVMAGVLAKHEKALQNDKFGQFIYRKLAIGHFIRRNKEWRDIQTGAIRKRQLFQGIIGDTDAGPQVKKFRGSDEDDDKTIVKR